MSISIVAALASWLTLAAPPPVESPPAARLTSAESAAWVERLKSLRDHMHTAFGVGPDLTLLDPDQGVAIVREAWPQISEADVKTGLLKTFAFSKALPRKHAKLFLVLDLGMNDSDPKIREYAAAYLEKYAGKDVTGDSKKYAAWFAEFGEKAPEEVPQSRQPSAAAEKVQASTLNARGWRQFFSQDYPAAEATFRELLEASPENLAGMNGLGFSLLNQGRTAEAKSYFETYLAKEPKAPGPLNGLARCLEADGQLDEAIAVWEKGYALSPGPNDIAAGLGLAYLEKGEKAKAIPLLEHLVKAQPDNVRLAEALQKAREEN